MRNILSYSGTYEYTHSHTHTPTHTCAPPHTPKSPMKKYLSFQSVQTTVTFYLFILFYGNRIVTH